MLRLKPSRCKRIWDLDTNVEENSLCRLAKVREKSIRDLDQVRYIKDGDGQVLVGEIYMKLR